MEAEGVGEAECDLRRVGLPEGEEKGEKRGERPGGPFRGASSISKRRGSCQKGLEGRIAAIRGLGKASGGVQSMGKRGDDGGKRSRCDVCLSISLWMECCA